MKVTNINDLPARVSYNGTVQQWELLREDDFLSSVNVFHANILNSGDAAEPHQHESEEQIYFVLGGIGTVKVGNEQREVREGDTVYLPPRMLHSMKNSGTYPLRFLAIGAKIK